MVEAAWAALARQGARLKAARIDSLFAADARRFARFSREGAGLLLDISKNRIDEEALAALLALAKGAMLEEARGRMFSGERINVTEHRAVLHVALRAGNDAGLVVDGHDVLPDVRAVKARVEAFAEQVRSGAWRGFTGKPIRHVVNIGIGGSDLGPRMAAAALSPHLADDLALHYVANVDGADLAGVLDRVAAEETLFIVASKTFTTQETMANAASARAWLRDQGAEEADVAKHFVAVSTNAQAVAAFGISAENMFPFWDWVGGRFSLWSAIGLSLAIGLGSEGFEALLSGAREMDGHFLEAPLAENLPVLLALTEIWNRNIEGHRARAVVPYDERLALLPAYLQQLEMESNGKRLGLDGEEALHATAPVVWGGAGTNGQHAYFQHLHQGTDVVPVDFIAAIAPDHGLAGHHRLLMANLFAQGEALMRGRASPDGNPHRAFPGNRPSTAILMDRLTPERLGALLALYEHKVFCLGVLWGVPSFDQWGVELGKELAGSLLKGTGVPSGLLGWYNSRARQEDKL
ncbi:MAG: glucose-6-phosphate isomerase [Alphaproteobacteria bacterium]|nr:glucose-6-phosphate isomerase [Alphaproteobacteria bacterium]